MAKDPAMLFYSADFMMGAMLLTMEERGQYITLLCVMHQQGRLTIEEMETVLMCKVSKNILKKFQKDSEEKYFNERLELEKNKRTEFSKSRRNSLDINNKDMVYIYLVKAPYLELYKIGSSKYPQLRIKEIVKYKPGAEFYWISDGLFERSNERILHEKYSDKKEKYDWFLLNSEDLESIKESFRTVNENENVNTILNKEKETQKKVFDLMPTDCPMIPDIKIAAAQELLKITKQVDVSKESIVGMWSIFKVQNLTGKKFYADTGQVYSHFINWVKTQTFPKEVLQAKSNGPSPSELKAKRILEETK